MSRFTKGIALTLTGAFVAVALASIAYPQGAGTLFQITFGQPATVVTAANPLPVTGGGTAGNPSLIDCSSISNVLCGLINAPIPVGSNNIGNVGSISQYPNGATPITASATGTTAATTATLAASASIKTYICGFSIRANATGAATNNSTVTGTITGTLNYTQWTAPLASGIGLTEQIYSPCIPSSAVNTAIAVISGAPGSGGVVSVAAWGYQL